MGSVLGQMSRLDGWEVAGRRSRVYLTWPGFPGIEAAQSLNAGVAPMIAATTARVVRLPFLIDQLRLDPEGGHLTGTGVTHAVLAHAPMPKLP